MSACEGDVAAPGKVCTTCRAPKARSEFYRHSAARSVLRYQCKACTAAYNATPEVREKRRAYDAAYRATPEGKELRRAYLLRKYGHQPEKENAS